MRLGPTSMRLSRGRLFRHSLSQRVIEPEELDNLWPSEPSAVASRRDLCRLNSLMRHPQMLARLLQSLSLPRGYVLLELGAGDGYFLRNLLRRLPASRRPGRVILVDRLPAAGDEVIAELERLTEEVEVVTADLLHVLKDGSVRADIFLSNLFLHHLQDEVLRHVFRWTSHRCRALVALEPRRTLFPWAASHLIALLGCDRVTRHDAVVSVRAGFCGEELKRLWPQRREWTCTEQPAGWFSHRFTAVRDNIDHGACST